MLTVRPHPLYLKDLDSLPLGIVKEVAWIVRALCRYPYSPGVGFSVNELQNKELRLPAWTVHFRRDAYRILYVVDGSDLCLYAIGPRPGFFRELERLKDTLD